MPVKIYFIGISLPHFLYIDFNVNQEVILTSEVLFVLSYLSFTVRVQLSMKPVSINYTLNDESIDRFKTSQGEKNTIKVLNSF